MSYYQKNTLGDNFPFVNTTLRFPYKSLYRGAHGTWMFKITLLVQYSFTLFNVLLIGKSINEYAEDFPGSPEPEPPELPPRTPSMSIVNPSKTLQDQPYE